MFKICGNRKFLKIPFDSAQRTIALGERLRSGNGFETP